MLRAHRPAVIAIALTTAAVGAGGAILVTSHRPAHAQHGLRAAAVTSPNPPVTGASIVVNGAPVPAVDSTTVADALTAAAISVRSGRYLAVVSHRPLGSDGRPARVVVDGRPATLTTHVVGGEDIRVRPGADEVEPTETVSVHLAPDVRSALYVGSRDGLARLTRGTISHERVSERLVRRPRNGHLLRPGAVALTFDDGPSTGYTRRVLALLAHAHVHATFCMIGSQAAARPWLVRAVVAAGDELCDHTWDHDLQLRARPAGQIALDISRGRHAIVHATHGRNAPAFFRAPGGNWSTQMEHIARKQRMTPLKWTVDPRDWARPGVKSILKTVYAELRPGGVILMHDGGGDRSETVSALRVLLHRLPKLGYHFVLPPAGHSQHRS